MNNKKSFRPLTILCSMAFILGGFGLSSAMARPITPDSGATPTLTDAELDGLVRKNAPATNKIVPYLNSRLRSFIVHGEQIPRRVGGSAEFHYRKMMTELMRTYDFLQVSKPHMESSKFVQYSKEWRLLQAQVVLSQQLHLAQPSRSTQVLASAVRKAKQLELQLKAVDRLL